MVKRYTNWCLATHGHDLLEMEDRGLWVKHHDYLTLQKALKEALDGWQADLAIYCLDNKLFEHRNKKPSQLRSQFLEGRKPKASSKD